MSDSLNEEERERVKRFRESLRLLSYRKRKTELGEPQSEEDPLREAVRSYDGKPSPLQIVIEKMEKEDPYL